MSGNGMYFGGLPTAIDTKKLEEAFGIPDVGRLIAYPEIEAVIGHRWKTNRFTTVVSAWRRNLRKNHNVDTDAIPSEGVKVLDMTERVGVSARDLKRGVRGIRGAAIRVSTVDESKIGDAIERAKATKTKEVATRIYMMTSNEVKTLTPPKPVAALPRVNAG